MTDYALSRRTACGGLFAILAGCSVAPRSTLSPQDQSDVARIQSYLDGLHGLRANFVQTGPDGAITGGMAWYDPGRLRLQYDASGGLVVVASGQHLVAHRNSDDSTTRIALSNNPLGLLLAHPLQLSGDIEVTDIQRGPGILQASLARAANPAQGLLTLILSDRPAGLALVGLEAVDSRRQRTHIQLSNAQTGLELDPGLFTPPAS